MIWKVLIFAIAAFVLYKLFIGDKNKKSQEKVGEQKERQTSGELVKDPACGVYVSTDTDIRVRDGEHIYYFCSYECREKFLEGAGHISTDTTSEIKVETKEKEKVK